MATIVPAPMIHRAFFANASVRAMISLGYSVDDARDVHLSFVYVLQEVFAGPLTQKAVDTVFGWVLQRRFDDMTPVQRDRMTKRAALFKTIPKEEWTCWNEAQWERGAKCIEIGIS